MLYDFFQKNCREEVETRQCLLFVWSLAYVYSQEIETLLVGDIFGTKVYFRFSCSDEEDESS